MSANEKDQAISKKSNRSASDQARDRCIYEYLITLTDSTLEGCDESLIAEQWGMSGKSANRMFVSRILKAFQEQGETFPGITLNRLVNILKSIDKYRQKKCKKQTSVIFPRILTRAEKLRALRLYSKPLLEEKEDLGFKEHESHLLLQQLIEDITDSNKGLSPEKISEIYKYISGIARSTNNEEERELNDIDKIIQDSLEKVASEYFKDLSKEPCENLKSKMVKKVNNAIRDIEYQNGSYQFRSFLDYELELAKLQGNAEKSSAIKQQKKEIRVRFSPKKFIKRLTKTIIENQVLIEEFPVNLKYIEIQEIQQSIPQIQENNIRNSNRLFAYTARVYFYLKNDKNEKEEFYEEVTGVGSPLSHAIAAMNRALLWDIKSLKDYIPIAKQITFNSEIVGPSINGSVWSHYVVALCKRDNLDPKNNICPVEELAHGDYCGFDTLEVYAKAAFYARLRAIKKTGVYPNKYITELRNKITQVRCLRAGEEMLNEYPFSLEVMKYHLAKNLLANCYQLDAIGLPIPISIKQEMWSLTEYEAHLSVTEAYFKEGLYAIGKIYLDCMENHIKEFASKSISKIIIARYHICYFRYHYLTDLADQNYGNGKNHSRAAAITNANDCLDAAYQSLKEYVDKCNAIDELPHVNFYGFCTVMSKLYADRAKLHFFMSTHLPNKSISDTIQLFEVAKMYAARSGDSSLYSMWSAYQSWCYLVAAYTEHENDKNQEIDKAEKTLIYALQSYEKIGRKYYESLKLKSGMRNSVISHEGKVEIDYEVYGDISIQGIPIIKEFNKQENDQINVGFSSTDGSLYLDISALTSDLPNTSTLLFGTQSCILIFAIAMLKLCHYNHEDSEILNEMTKARKMFCYAWTFAEDGIHQLKDNDPQKLDRWSDENPNSDSIPACYQEALESRHLSGLYPHRLTQFADFGKIYFIACELILLSDPASSDREIRWQYIEKLLTALKDNPLTIRGRYTSQKRYNGHLQEHFAAIDRYVKDFKQITTQKSLQEIRDAVVKDIATILRTAQIQVPSL